MTKRRSVTIASPDGREADQDGDRRKIGPEPDRLIIEGFDSWEDAVRAGLNKKPPPGGWPERADEPKPEPKPGRRKK